MESLTLEIDGTVVGALSDSELTRVVPRLFETGSENKPRRSIDPFLLKCGAFASGAAIDWISGAADQNFPRRNIRLIHADRLSRADKIYELSGCLLEGVQLPAMDKASTSSVSMLLRVAAEYVHVTNSRQGASRKAHPTKSWNASGFEVEIEGLDARTVQTMDALTFKGIVKLDTSVRGQVKLSPTKSVFPDIRLGLPNTQSKGLTKWMEDSASARKSGKPDIRKERVRYLAGDGSIVADVDLLGLELVGFSGRAALTICDLAVSGMRFQR